MAENLMRAPRIRIHFDVHEPIELVAMTLALQGLGQEYQSYAKERAAPNERRNVSDIKLYITKIESNCILAELAPAVHTLAAVAPIVNDASSVIEFVRNTKAGIDWLRGAAENKKLDPEDIPYNKRKIRNFESLVDLIKSNEESSLGLDAVDYEEATGEDHTALHVTFSGDECKEASQGAAKALQALETTEAADYSKVLMYFYQTNIDDPKSTGRTGDRALIKSITDKPLKVYVIPETDQQRIRYVLDDVEHNPLHTGFVVDVSIEKDAKGDPKTYRVLNVYDVVYDED